MNEIRLLGATPRQQRFEALKTLREKEIGTSLFIGLILPGVTDLLSIFRSLEGSIDYVFGEALNRHCGNRFQVFRTVSLYDSNIRPLFDQAVKNRAYWEAMKEEFYALATKHGVAVAGFFSHLDTA